MTERIPELFPPTMPPRRAPPAEASPRTPPMPSPRSLSRNKMPSPDAAPSVASPPDLVVDIVRSAVREELLDCLGGPMREIVRTELAAALQDRLGQADGKAILEEAQCKSADGNVTPVPSVDASEPEQAPQGENKCDRVMIQTVSRYADLDGPSGNRGSTVSSAVEDDLEHWRSQVHQTAKSFRSQLGPVSFEEPQRSGRLARIVTGKRFQLLIGAVIFVNLWCMVHDANITIRDPTDRSMMAVNWVFTTIYCLEIVLKLAVHRQWFFCNADWKTNVFDIVVVSADLVSAVMDTTVNLSFMRVLRPLRFGKAIRFVQVMYNVESLRGFIVCLQCSFSTWSWSVIMLFSVYGIFALLFMQVISWHLYTTDEALDASDFASDFGSFGASVVTLFIVTTGGDDWRIVYRYFESAGPVGACIFIVFIAFVNFSVLNIITGIFVDSAMKVLAPDSEMLANEHVHQERDNARKLISLCQDVDHDCSGKLTQEKFEEGLKKHHIPRTLLGMGLQKRNLVEFFDTLAKASDDGQVDIDTFVNGCMLLKGTSTNFDLQKMYAEIQVAHTTIIQLLRDIPVAGRRARSQGFPSK